MKKWIVAFFAFTMVCGLAFSAAADTSIKVDKSVVEISTFYNGTTIHASGQVPPGAEAVIRVSGRPENTHVKKKGKVGGLLWMNVGDLEFDNAPKVYMLYAANADMLQLGSAEYPMMALKDRIEIKPDGEDTAFLLKEFLRMKKKASVYAENADAVSYSSDGASGRQYDVDLVIPPRMRPDDYSIEVFAVAGNKVIGTSTQELQIKQVGFPAQLTALAFDHSLLHGILAVLIAIAAGFLMGAIFKGKGGAH